MVIGGFSLATWLGEKLSNEVTGRTRLTNRRITERFAALTHNQIDRACAWLESQAPSRGSLEKLVAMADEIQGQSVMA